MENEQTKNLDEHFKHVYICDECKTKYGSDKIEKDKHLCPICEKK